MGGHRCEHQGFHTATSRYDAAGRVLVWVMVCDDCLAELREVQRQPYLPEPRGDRGQRDRTFARADAGRVLGVAL